MLDQVAQGFFGLLKRQAHVLIVRKPLGFLVHFPTKRLPVFDRHGRRFFVDHPVWVVVDHEMSPLLLMTVTEVSLPQA